MCVYIYIHTFFESLTPIVSSMCPEACQPLLGISYHASATAAGPRDWRSDSGHMVT